MRAFNAEGASARPRRYRKSYTSFARRDANAATRGLRCYAVFRVQIHDTRVPVAFACPVPPVTYLRSRINKARHPPTSISGVLLVEARRVVAPTRCLPIMTDPELRIVLGD